MFNQENCTEPLSLATSFTASQPSQGHTDSNNTEYMIWSNRYKPVQSARPADVKEWVHIDTGQPAT